MEGTPDRAAACVGLAGLVADGFRRAALAAAASPRTRLAALVTGPTFCGTWFDVVPVTVGFAVSETWYVGCIPAVLASFGRTACGTVGKVSDGAEFAVPGCAG